MTSKGAKPSKGPAAGKPSKKSATGKGRAAPTPDPKQAAKVERRATVLRAAAVVLLLVCGAVILVWSMLPGHPHVVTATVTSVVSTSEITVALPDGQHATLAVDPSTTFQQDESVLVTLRGDDPSTATIGDTHSGLVNPLTGACMLVAGVLLSLPLVRTWRERRAKGGS